jgi:hypothetical protein
VSDLRWNCKGRREEQSACSNPAKFSQPLTLEGRTRSSESKSKPTALAQIHPRNLLNGTYSPVAVDDAAAEVVAAVGEVAVVDDEVEEVVVEVEAEGPSCLH